MPFKTLSEKDKFSYTILNLVALRGISGAAIGAGFEELGNTPKEWHRDGEGYGLRAASTFGGALTRQTLNLAFVSALHEDPRYFPLDHGPKYMRLWSAIRQTFVTRTDSGKATFAYGSVASAFATGQIVGLWQPPSNNSATDGVERGFIGLGVDAAVNLLYEFFPKTRPKEIVSQP